jgi:hypothetical protein
MVSFAGSCGDINVLKEAWQVVLDAASAEQRPLEGKDWGALIAGVGGLHTREAIDFLEEEVKRLDGHLSQQSLAHLEDLVSNGKTINKPSALTKIDKDAALTSLTKILTNAITIIAEIRDNPNYQIDHDTLQISISASAAPTSLPDLWKVYNEVSVDPAVRSDPGYKDISYDKLQEYPVLARRFRDWASITELMIQADRQSKSAAKRKAIVDEETDVLQEPENHEDVTFGEGAACSFEEFRRHVLQLRGVPRQIVQY